jgi:hypothetical protein
MRAIHLRASSVPSAGDFEQNVRRGKCWPQAVDTIGKPEIHARAKSGEGNIDVLDEVDEIQKRRGGCARQ